MYAVGVANTLVYSCKLLGLKLDWEWLLKKNLRNLLENSWNSFYFEWLFSFIFKPVFQKWILMIYLSKTLRNWCKNSWKTPRILCWKIKWSAYAVFWNFKDCINIICSTVVLSAVSTSVIANYLKQCIQKLETAVIFDVRLLLIEFLLPTSWCRLYITTNLNFSKINFRKSRNFPA